MSTCIGGASGIGPGVCQLFAQNGHRVAMLDMREEALAREGAALAVSGVHILARVDVADRASIDAAYEEVRSALGLSLSSWPTPASPRAPTFAPCRSMSGSGMIDVNLRGIFHTVQAAVADMVDGGRGRIVTISSQAAQSGAQDRADYAPPRVA